MSSFSWWPLGGLGEVGMNCMLFKFGETVIPVDAGILFADPNDFGIEAIFPNFDEVLKIHKPKYWLVTHAHEDHIGAIPAVLSRCHELKIEAPEFLLPPFAAALVRERLKDDSRFKGVMNFYDKIKSVEVNSKWQIGEVCAHFIETRHSTVETCSIAFEWKDPATGVDLRVVHTADFKLDSNKFEDGIKTAQIYRAFGNKNPDFLFIDSTNSERPGHSVSELEILPGLERLINDQSGRVFVTLFSSNVYRLAALAAIGHKVGRHVCLAGRSMQTAFRVAEELGILKNSTPDFSKSKILDPSEISSQPPEKQLILCSGSQGEFRSVLSKLAADQHPHFVLHPGDSVIFSSKMIPGNERPVSRLINGLLRQGAKVFWGDYGKSHAGGPIHASGHARSGELREVMETLKPRHIVPVHGELRQLKSCAEIAEVAGASWGMDSSKIHVVENGSRLEFSSKSGDWELESKQINPTPPRMLRFESFVATSKDPFLRVRKKVAQGGLVMVSLDSLGRSRINISGMLPLGEGGEKIHESLIEEISNWVHGKYKSLLREDAFHGENSQIEGELCDELSRFLRRISGIRPYVQFHIMPG